jgi:hypothetical protein
MSWLSFFNLFGKRNKSEIKPSQMLPRKVILVITTHGCVQVNNNHEPVEMIVPEGMKIVKISATGLGEVNYLEAAIEPPIIEKIQYNTTSLLVANSKQDYVHILRDIIDFIKEKEIESMRPTPKTKTKTKTKTKKTKKPIDPDVANYLNQRKNKLNHRVSFFNSNDRLMDKEFFRTITCNEDDPDDDIDRCGYDYKINMVNVDGNPNLLTMMPPVKNDRYYTVKLHDIVDYLKNAGVQEIIIFDFSCSNFEYAETLKRIPPRTSRSLKRSLLIRNTSESNKKTKTNANTTDVDDIDIDLEPKYVGYGGYNA